MGRILSFFKTLIKRKLFWFALAAVVLIGGYFVNKNIASQRIEYVTEDAVVGNISQTVSATGAVTTSDKVDLNFKITGTLSEISVTEGDEVTAGQVLAKLNDRSARSQVAQAQASLSSAVSNLNKILAGASPQDIQISQETVNNAKTAYESAQRDYEALAAKLDKDIDGYEKAVTSAETSLTDSQKNLENAKVYYSQSVTSAKSTAITSMETNLLSGDIVLNNINYNLSIIRSGITADQQKVYQADNDRLAAISASTSAKAALNIAKTTNDVNDVYSALNQTVLTLNKILTSLSNLLAAVSTAAASSFDELTTIETLKTSIKADQTSTSTALSAVQTAQQSLLNAQNNYQTQIDTYQAAVNTANNSLLTARTSLATALASKDVQLASSKASVDSALGSYNLAKAQFDYKTAAPRTVDVSYYRAQVASASASLEYYRSQLEDYTLKAPTDGKITFVNYSVGEQTSLTKAVVSMLGKNKFYIEVDIPESDIAKVKVGNPVLITLDAYSDDVKFNGQVILVYPAETVIQDVVYYKVKVEIEETTYEIKSGMTANCDILTDHRENVLTMPARALQDENGRQFVRILVNGKPMERDVTVGLRGDEGEIEVNSGLNTGDKVIILEKKP
ncbi:efflux RND transporter periplasmic adaptor subunit [Candidatus Falkowbacteria bacterium]|nr:efflux RND transporter periplasmic adaptor subunit [Candidatus Falkowbacteria bacterium]